jgi:2-methylcitrate dehydratase PrpD
MEKETFTDKLCHAVTEHAIEAAERELLARSVADILSVAAAAFATSLMDAAERAMAGDGGRLGWNRTAFARSHGATFVNGAASHMLDFDDLHLASSAHVSAVIVPALLSMPGPSDADALFAAMRAGFVTATAVARRLGPDHYRKGWHATGTIGAIAATAGRARLVGLGAVQLRHALALAAAQAGGLHLNFGTTAKPLHAGFASAAATRSVALAANGVTGAPDVFGAGGFFELYGSERGEAVHDFEPALDTLTVKLFPCCFAAHRLIGAALQARDNLGSAITAPELTFRLTVPAQSIYVLRHDRPTTGAEGIFSAPYPVAVALLEGTPALGHFTDAAVNRADVQALLPRIEIVEDQNSPSDGKLDSGEVVLEVMRAGDIVGRYRQRTIPGSATDPQIAPRLREKIRFGLRQFEEAAGFTFPPAAAVRRFEGMEEWIPE